MTAFESYLIEQGWGKFTKNKHNEYVPTDKHVLSTLENLDHRYLKDGIEIVFGLHERGKPATLISPRPFTAREVKGENTYICPVSDDQMNRILSAFHPRVVLKAALTGKNLTVTETNI